VLLISKEHPEEVYGWSFFYLWDGDFN